MEQEKQEGDVTKTRNHKIPDSVYKPFQKIAKRNDRTATKELIHIMKEHIKKNGDKSAQ